MSERTIKLVVSYDGTDFCGWQRQQGQRSIQGALEDALARMHGHPINIQGAGRTDSGVHASRQVAHFYTDIKSIPPEKFRLALNKLLPRDVRVIESSQAHDDFHARYDARLRRYRYYLHSGPETFPGKDRYSWQLKRRPDLTLLNAMSTCILGEREFTTFSSAKDISANRWRFVHHASWRCEGDQIVFEVAANAFLWRMVRSLVGSMIEYEAQGYDAQYMNKALLARDRFLSGPSAPARGLFLWNVEYYRSPTRRGRKIENQVKPGEGIESKIRLVPGYGEIHE